MDDRDIAGIIRQFKARRLDLVIDYEHQTLSDVQAPAAGWNQGPVSGVRMP